MTSPTVDPILSLALSMYNGKGIYALLLASGISNAAGIPTGWDITLRLVGMLHKLSGGEATSEPLEEWYRKTCQTELDYSDVLRRVTQTSAERLQLLRQFFEPTEEEKREGIKLPTAAHHAIAGLVAKGYVRVIVTTNFDRLLEQALSAQGVEATVISTADSVKGAVPLAHSPCTIVKVHGDYLDARLKNTEEELAHYDPEFNTLLDEIFDHYGLIVCGWSAAWDVALRSALERCSNRRYGTYWALRGEPGAQAQKLIGLRKAVTLTIQDADSFFTRLEETVEAVAELTLTDHTSARVAVARVKRYIGRSEEAIRLYDMIAAEADRVECAIREMTIPRSEIPTQAKATPYLHRYELILESLLPMLACAARWGSESEYEMIVGVIRQIAQLCDDNTQHSYASWRKMGRYPAIVLFYGVCLASIARSNVRLINKLLELKFKASQHEEEEYISAILSPFFVWNPNDQRGLMEGREKEPSPLNNHIYDLLKPELKAYFWGSDAFERAFDWLEYVLALDYAHKSYKGMAFTTDSAGRSVIMAPLGRFFWKNLTASDAIQQRMKVDNPGALSPGVLAAMGCGICLNIDSTLDHERFNLLKGGVDAFTQMARREIGIYF